MAEYIKVKVLTINGKDNEIETPLDIRVNDFITELADTLNLGKKVVWRLYNKDIGRTLDRSKTLEENGVKSGHTLAILRIDPGKTSSDKRSTLDKSKQPDEMTYKKSAIIPYRRVNKKLQILLVTKSKDKGRTKGRKWIVPKGKIEAELPPDLAALKELLEEAGVLGKGDLILVGEYRESRNGYPIPVYLVEVNVELPDNEWKERGKRKRQWVDSGNCEQYIDERLSDVMKKGIRYLQQLK